MGFYTEVTSEHLKRLIAITPWEMRKTIDDLVLLHRFLVEGVRGVHPAMHFSQLQRDYPHDYLILLRELGEDRYEEELRQQRWRAEERRRLEQDCAERLAARQADWLAAGGAL